MIETGSGQIKHKALIIDESLSSRDTAAGRAACSLVDHMRNMDMAVTEAISVEDGSANIVPDMSIHAVLISWELEGTTDGEPAAVALLREMRGRHNDIPVFLMAKSSKSIKNITEEVMSLTDEFIWMLVLGVGYLLYGFIAYRFVGQGTADTQLHPLTE